MTRELFDAVVDKLLIYENGAIELFVKYHDIYEQTEQYIHQLDGKEETAV